MKRIRTFGVTAVIAAAALLLAGCSGDAGSATPAGNGAPPASSVAGSTAPSTSSTAGSATAPITVTDPTADTQQGTDASDPATSSSVQTTRTTTTKPKPKSATVTASPAFGTDELNPLDPMKLTVKGGKIATLAVYAEDGSKIAGKLSADRTGWTSDQRLRYGGTYHAKGTATGAPGSATTKIDGIWTTFDPPTQTTRISPGDGALVGVAAPIIIRFGACIADHADVEKHVTVTTDPKVTLRGTWIQHDGDQCRSLDLRPADFWPEGTKVHVSVDLLGIEVSDGLYGARETATSDFTIGRNRVTYANPQDKRLIVKEDGKVVADYPTSMGSGDDVGDPHRVTRSGIHVVTGKEADKKMTSERYHYKDLPEPWAVRISNNGEFIHQNMETIDVQGIQNVSHGCLNLSDVNAKAYFEKAMYGDPVVITGTSVQLGPSDGDIYDWAIPFSEWHSLNTASS
ncbi:L,D-transpeptidase [Nakamurella lactea]|uniref:L,D-transpeptidase n=1 Tax=Nakamurella lactea TaxID=459515 RepID=UPI0004028703|nr:Ig-like domain-containing protein [Nakamurella lactea]